ncbi:MAG: hypothetical protein JSS49_07105 [Planctomycetes bacterium]|nr:hypothetical protein [Planctomycetota bacterium]
MAQPPRWSKTFWIFVGLSLVTPVFTIVPYVMWSEQMQLQSRWHRPESLRSLAAVRKENPIVPLGDRVPKPDKFLALKTPPRIAAEAENELKEYEKSTERSYREIRDIRLSSLHLNTLTEFAERVGFGEDRLWSGVVQGPHKLTSDDPPPIPIGESPTAESSDWAITEGKPDPAQLLMLPELHHTSFVDFVDPLRLGVVLTSRNLARTVTWTVNENRVTQKVQDWSQLPSDSPLRPLSVGHTEHSMTARVKQEFEKHLTEWQLSKLELVSLLKAPTPRVYRSRNLPNMKELANARSRELNEFEAVSLTKLQSGERLIIESDHFEIRMLGSVRAASQCVECHSVMRGTLLGAFSYVLHRLPAKKETAQASLEQ